MSFKKIIKDRVTVSAIVLIALFIAAGLVLAVWNDPISYIKSLTNKNPVYAPIIYIAVEIISIIIAPITTIPLVPLFIGILGQGPMLIYTVFSWVVGGVGAFLIGRRFGRPVLSKIISLKELGKYRKFIPEHYEFVAIILLRILIPVDLLSYALGFFSKISLWKYTLATAIGVTPGAILLVYAGSALITGNIFLAILFAIIGVVVFAGAAWFWKKYKNKIMS